MILKEYDLSIRLPYERTIDTGITLVQNDKDVYKFNVRVFDGVNEIDYSNVTTATITFSKSDKNVVQGDMVVGVDKLTYTLGTNEIACSGKVIVSVQLWGTTERLTTARFLMQVDKDLITEDAVESTSEFPILQRVVQDVAEIVPLLPDIEQTIQDFPEISAFFDTAETSETQRIGNEATRQTQENARQASIADIEDRFDDLTASQQQDAEVIDARDGEASLNARLSRDKGVVDAHLAENAKEATEFTITNNAIHNITGYYYKKNGWVYLQMAVNRVDGVIFSTTENIIATPVGFRPKQNFITEQIADEGYEGSPFEPVKIIIFSSSGMVRVARATTKKHLHLQVVYYAGGGTV